MDKNIENYVLNNLSQDWAQIKKSKNFSKSDELNEFKKTLIWHYSDDGFESLNETLRNGGEISDFGKFLNNVLDKLPDYNLLCYRTIKSNKSRLQKYYDALESNSIIIEKSFLSCSKSKMLASYFSSSPLFIIKSKKGKEIEKFAKFGIDSGQNEKEILFQPNAKFQVLDILEEDGMITITLEEI